LTKAVRISRDGGELLLRILEQRKPVISADALDECSPAASPALASAGALVLHGAMRSVLTDGDDGPAFREVAALAEGNEIGYFDAADGSVAVSPDARRLLQVSLSWWLSWLANALDLTNCTRPAEIVVGHAWDVGDLWIDRRRKVPVIFARRLHRADNCHALVEALKKRAGRGDPLILTSGRNPPARLDPGLTLAPVSLFAVLTNDADDFAIDRELVLSPYAAAGNTGPTEPLYLSPDGRLLVLKGVEVQFKSPIHVEIIRQIVAAHPTGALAREVLEKAGSAAPTFQKAFGAKKWAQLKASLKSKGGLWGFDL
jgi:hypothetical protein